MKMKIKLTAALAIASVCTRGAMACPVVYSEGARLVINDSVYPSSTNISIMNGQVMLKHNSVSGQESYSKTVVGAGEYAGWFLQIFTASPSQALWNLCPDLPAGGYSDVAEYKYLRPDSNKHVFAGFKNGEISWSELDGDEWVTSCSEGTIDDFAARVAEAAGANELVPSEYGTDYRDTCPDPIDPIATRCFLGTEETEEPTTRCVGTPSTIVDPAVICDAAAAAKVCFEPTAGRSEIREELGIGNPAHNNPAISSDLVRSFFDRQRRLLETGLSSRATGQTVKRLRQGLASADANSIVNSRSAGSTAIRQIRRQVAKLPTRNISAQRTALTRILARLNRLS